jgi:hypothetical protein
MNCNCTALPDAFYLDEGPDSFAEGLTREERGDWIRLGSCPRCGALWAVDEWERLQDQVVTRVRSREGWAGIDATDARKQLLLESRGGLTDAECAWSGCDGRAVKGVVYCLDHLWETGVRR